MEEDVSEWVDLAAGSGVRIYPAIEEAFMAGHTSGFRRWYLKPPIIFFGTTASYDYDNREALDDIGDLRRLEHKSVIFVVTRSADSFPNCLQNDRQIPTPLTAEHVTLTMDVPDDLRRVVDRLHSVSLWFHLDNLTVEDEVAVEL